MFRRSARPAAPEAAAPQSTSAPGRSVAPGGLAAQLSNDGWVLPRGVISGGTPAWTLVGTVASPTVTPVDRAGLVVGEGWGLDWWVGADDRWHVPTREAATRQQLLDDAPVVETMVRIPGGDAVHRAYGIRSPRPVGDEWVVVEVQNATAIPFAVALVIRPMEATGIGAISSITIEPVGGGSGLDEAHLVRIDGRPAVVLPRQPARIAVGNHASGDVLDTVSSGRAGRDLTEAACPDGLATMALIFPLTHTSVLRVAVPVGEVGDDLDYPSVMPDSATVASGWEIHRRGPRFELPDQRLTTALARARAAINLAHDGELVRRDGHRSPDIEPEATAVLLRAFDVLDRPNEVGPILVQWGERPSDADPETDAMVLTAIATHWRLHHVDGFLDWTMPQAAAAVERLDRAHRKGRLDTAGTRRRAASALENAGAMLAEAGQTAASAKVVELSRSVLADRPAPQPGNATEQLIVAAHQAASGDPTAFDHISAATATASATSAFPGPGPHGRPIGQDLAASAALVVAVRSLVVAERPGELILLPVHPDAWYGGGIEVHDAPTAHGRLSYAIRWHGTRPALLWELEPHDGTSPVTITVPGLDPTWSTTEPRGEALLAEVAPPAQAEAMTLVAEHADILPEMRRPGAEPAAVPLELPEGGSFS